LWLFCWSVHSWPAQTGSATHGTTDDATYGHLLGYAFHHRAVIRQILEYLLLAGLSEFFEAFDTGADQRPVDQTLGYVHAIGAGQLRVDIRDPEGATDAGASGTE
jgi:hypothetical protein